MHCHIFLSGGGGAGSSDNVFQSTINKVSYTYSDLHSCCRQSSKVHVWVKNKLQSMWWPCLITTISTSKVVILLLVNWKWPKLTSNDLKWQNLFIMQKKLMKRGRSLYWLHWNGNWKLNNGALTTLCLLVSSTSQVWGTGDQTGKSIHCSGCIDRSIVPKFWYKGNCAIFSGHYSTSTENFHPLRPWALPPGGCRGLIPWFEILGGCLPRNWDF